MLLTSLTVALHNRNRERVVLQRLDGAIHAVAAPAVQADAQHANALPRLEQVCVGEEGLSTWVLQGLE